MDFEELRPQQQSFEMLAAYLNGSTVNVTVDGRPQRYTGAYVTEEFLRILGVSPDDGTRLHEGGQHTRRRQGRDHRLRHLAARFRRRGRHRRQGRPDQRQARDDHRRDAERLCLPGQRGDLEPALQRVPAAAAERSDSEQSRRARPAARRTCRSIRPTPRRRRWRSASPPRIRRRTSSSTPARCSRCSSPSRRARCAARCGRCSGFCVGVLLIACVNVMNMQFARATLRAKELAVRSSLGATRLRLVGQMLTESLLVAGIGAVVGIGLAYLSIDWLSATVRNLENPPPAYITFDVDAPGAGFHRVRDAGGSGASQGCCRRSCRRARTRSRCCATRGRGNTSRRVNFVTRGTGRLPDRRDLRAAGRIAAAGALDHQPADDRLRLRHRRHHLRPHGSDGRRLSVAGCAQGVLRPPAAGAAPLSPSSSRSR